MNTSEPLKPLGIGEIVDRSVVFWRRNFRPLFFLYMSFGLPTFVAAKAAILVMKHAAPEIGNTDLLNTTLKYNPSGALAHVFSAFVACAPLFGLALVFSFLSNVCHSLFVGSAMLGPRLTPQEAIWAVARRTPTLLLGGVIVVGKVLGYAVLGLLPVVIIMVLMGMLAAILKGPAVLLAVLMTLVTVVYTAALMLYLMLRFVLVPPVLALENKGAGESVRRGTQLMTGRVGAGFTGHIWFRAGVVITIAGIIVLLVSLVTGLPALLIQNAYGNIFSGHGNANAIPEVYLLPAQLFQLLGQGLFAPIAHVVPTLFYLDLRVRREGLDLEQALARPLRAEIVG